MKILIVGNPDQHKEFQSKFTSQHEYSFVTHRLEASPEEFDAVFDFDLGDELEEFSHYADTEGLALFVNAPKVSLGELAFYQAEVSCDLFGFNGLPTMLEWELLEVSAYRPDQQERLAALCKALDTDFELVNDRVGMVTPRIICMIINEAFYTLQEGTASVEDIDLGMKLGTNYPVGPFEWCDRIGLNHVYEVLEALYEDTKEERYKICPLLKQQYLRLA